MPPRSGYELSDDPDDVGSEDGASVSSERDSVSTVDDDERYMDDVDADADADADVNAVNSESEREAGEREASSSDAHTANSQGEEGEEAAAEGSVEDREHHAEGSGANGEEEGQSGEGEEEGTSASSRPALPKRPSLTRSSVVPLSPAPPVSGVSMLRYFDENQGASEGQPGASDAEQPLERDGNDALLDTDTEPAVTVSEGEGQEGDPGPDSNAAALTEAMEQPEESLTTLERIILCAKSEMAYHR